VTRPKRIKGWWFCAADKDGKVRLPHGDGREVKTGETLSIEGGEIIACERGLHASVRPLDALKYAPGNIICRVEVCGDVATEKDKIAGRHRKVLWMADAGVALRRFACDCADGALHRERTAGREPDKRSWEAVRVARRHAIGQARDEDLDAAWAAAWAAARDAVWAAARDAARDAAWATARDAAWAAARDAAWAAARAAARDAARDAAWDAARDAARDAQNTLLTERLEALKP
jgi:hypothetical protein